MNHRTSTAAGFVAGLLVATALSSMAQPEEAKVAAAPPLVTNEKIAPCRVAPHGRASIAFLAQGRNAFVGLLRMEAGAAVPEHRDESEEVIYVLAGGGRLTMDGQAWDIGPGSAVLMPSNALVSYQNGDRELVAVQVFADPRSAAKYDAWRPPSPAPDTEAPAGSEGPAGK